MLNHGDVISSSWSHLYFCDGEHISFPCDKDFISYATCPFCLPQSEHFVFFQLFLYFVDLRHGHTNFSLRMSLTLENVEECLKSLNEKNFVFRTWWAMCVALVALDILGGYVVDVEDVTLQKRVGR